MSTRQSRALADVAQVFSLDEARDRQPGEPSAHQLAQARLKHGNRMGEPMRQNILKFLEDAADEFGEVTVEDKEYCAKLAGVTLRTINRTWARRMQVVLDTNRHPDDSRGCCTAACTGSHHVRGCRAGLDPNTTKPWLFKYNDRGDAVEFTVEEVAFIATFTKLTKAWDAIRSTPGHRLASFHNSTLYRAWENVSEPVRVGAKYGAKRQRAVEGTFPLSGRDMVNETWSIDEVDLKLEVDLRGHVVWPKAVVVRERLSGLPLAWLVTHGAANATDVGRVLAAAAIGYTLDHPYADDQLVVTGPARYLNADQGSIFTSDEGRAAARRLGIGPAPIESHSPQANGDHEVMHQPLLAHFADGAGWRHSWEDRSGKRRLKHGLPPFEAIVAEVDEFFGQFIHAAITKGPNTGMSRAAVYARAVDDGQVYDGHTITIEDEASFATFIDTRKYDATRGVLLNEEYYLSDQLANRAVNGQTVEVRQLLDPNYIYVYDERGKFLAGAGPRAAADPAEQHGLYQDRARRTAFVKNVAAQRAAAASKDSDKKNKTWSDDNEPHDVDAGDDHAAGSAYPEDPEDFEAAGDAEAAWNDAADGLTDAAEGPETAELDSPSPNPERLEDVRVVRTSSNTRKAPAPPISEADLEATEEALVERLADARARRISALTDEQQTSTTPTGQPDPTDPTSQPTLPEND